MKKLPTFIAAAIAILVFAGVIWMASSEYRSVHQPERSSPLGDSSAVTYTKAATTTQATVTTTSTLIAATSTARSYMTISNPGGQAVFCMLDNGKPAVTNAGIVVSTSSPVFTIAPLYSNVYVGAINCITSAGTAVISLYQR